MNSEPFQASQSSGEAGSRPSLSPHQHTFFSPELAPIRKQYISLLAKATVLIVAVMWAFLPLYWGSLASSNSLTHQLTAFVIDRDGSTIGQAITSAAVASTQQQVHPTLGWTIVSAAEFPQDIDVQNSVLDEKAWLAIVVAANATQNLLTAQEHGDSTYDPASTITVYYQQARNEVASNNYLVPLVTSLLQTATTHASRNLTSQFLLSLASSGNATAIEALIRAPATISGSVGWNMVNLRPYTATVATAVTLVGQIYLVIFSFIITMTNFPARQMIAKYLTLRSYLTIRVVVPLVLYIPLSLSFAMVSLPFHLPFGAKYTYAGGFFTFWVFVWMGMGALGLATEAMITFLGPKFMAFFLLPLIISNVSVASIPDELQPWLYRYGKAFPVYNMGLAIRTLIFDTKNMLGLNAGILLSWIVLNIITILLFTAFVRWRETRAISATFVMDSERASIASKGEKDNKSEESS